MKAITWAKKAKTLKKQYQSFDELKADCIRIFGHDHFLLENQIVKGEIGDVIKVDAVYIVEGGNAEAIHGARDIPIFSCKSDGSLTLLDKEEIIVMLTAVLAEHLEKNEPDFVKNFMRDVMDNQSLEDLFDLKSRLLNKDGSRKMKAKIKAKEGCFKLIIGGRVGSSKELMLRE